MKKIKKSAIILSGGKSTRLGGFPKSHLLYKNETFIEKLLGEVEDYEEKIISSNSLFLFKDSKINVIEDEIKGIGPIGGIYTCLKNCKYNSALVIGVDMPRLSMVLLNSLGKASIEGNIIIPICHGKAEPLCGIYSKNVISTIEENIEKGDYSLSSLLKREKTIYIDYINQRSFMHINNFRDYEILEKEWKGIS